MVMRIEAWLFAIGVATAVVVACNGSDDDDAAGQPICEEAVDDSDCEVCIKTGCCDQYAACMNDANCACVLACASENQTEAQCAARCKVADAEIDDVVTLVSGQGQTCSVQCEDRCTVYAFDDDDDGP